MTPDEKSNIVGLFTQVRQVFVGYGGQNRDEEILISLVVDVIGSMIEAVETGDSSKTKGKEADYVSSKYFLCRQKFFRIHIENFLGTGKMWDYRQDPYKDFLILSLTAPKFRSTVVVDCFDALKSLLIGIFNESVRINSWNGQSNYEIPSDLSRLTEEIIKKELSLFLLSSWVGQNGLSKLCRQAWFLVDKNIKNLNAVESSNSIGADGAIAMESMGSMFFPEESDMPSLESVLVPEAKHEVVAMALAIIGNFASYLKKKRGPLVPSSLDYSKLALGEVMTNAMQALADHVIKGYKLPRCFVVESQQSFEDKKKEKEPDCDQPLEECQLIWDGALGVRADLCKWAENYPGYFVSYHDSGHADLYPTNEKVQLLLSKLKNAEEAVTFVELRELNLLFNMFYSGDHSRESMSAFRKKLKEESEGFLKLFNIIRMVRRSVEVGIEESSPEWLDAYRAELMIPESSDLTTAEGLMEVMRSLIAQSYRENQRLEREAGLFHVSEKTLGNSVFLVGKCSGFSRTLRQSRFAELCQGAWRITNYGLPGKEPANSELSEMVNMILAKLCKYRFCKDGVSSLDKYKIKLVGLAVLAIEAVENTFNNPENSLRTVYEWRKSEKLPRVKIALKEASSLRTPQDWLRVLEDILIQLRYENNKIERFFDRSHSSGKEINGEPLIGATGFFGKTLLQSKLEEICRECYGLVNWYTENNPSVKGRFSETRFGPIILKIN